METLLVSLFQFVLSLGFIVNGALMVTLGILTSLRWTLQNPKAPLSRIFDAKEKYMATKPFLIPIGILFVCLGIIIWRMP